MLQCHTVIKRNFIIGSGIIYPATASTKGNRFPCAGNLTLKLIA